MAAGHTLSLVERIVGADLASTGIPVTPSITPTVGANELAITWSLESGETSEEQVVIRYQATGLLDPAKTLVIDWGDGSATETFSISGWTVDRKFQHEYTSAGSVTITTTLSHRGISDTVVQTLALTAAPSTLWDVNQIQIEKYQDGVRIFEPDWLDIDSLDTTFTDDRVQKNHSYRYRYRLRLLDLVQQRLVTSAFSAVTEQASWV